MSTLVLKLAGPLQSWGAESRFTERKTSEAPTKSGVVGLVASALGRRRCDDVSDLASWPMVVRIDQRGTIVDDFHTAVRTIFDKQKRTWVHGTRKSDRLPLSHRYYLSDAVFMVALEVEDDQIDGVADALLHPAFPLYLGRRSCPPATKVLFDVRRGGTPMQALSDICWQASATYARRSTLRHDSSLDNSGQMVTLAILRESAEGSPVRDVPLSFSPAKRDYGVRSVVYDTVTVTNPYVPKVDLSIHDPMAALEEASD